MKLYIETATQLKIRKNLFEPDFIIKFLRPERANIIYTPRERVHGVLGMERSDLRLSKLPVVSID